MSESGILSYDVITAIVASEKGYIEGLVDAIEKHPESRDLYIQALGEMCARNLMAGAEMAEILRAGVSSPLVLEGLYHVTPDMVQATDDMLEGVRLGANAVLSSSQGGEI